MDKVRKTDNLMEKVISLAKRRGFVYPGSEIYGGFGASYDYGPLGVELKNNIKALWWQMFVREREDMVGLDSALVMNPKVWEASGHLKNFTDPMVDCTKCKRRFRADTLEEDPSAKLSSSLSLRAEGGAGKCPECGGQLTDARQFNLLFKTFVGPVEDDASVAYLRPETAAGMFVNFKNIMDTTRRKLPFGIAQIGRSFRNEITPGNFIFRMREFEQMEVEYFIDPKDWKAEFEMWLKEMKRWCAAVGINEKHLVFHEIEGDERAFYSKRTVDIEYLYPFGQKELYGLAYRTDYDLSQHAKFSGADLNFTDPTTNKKFIPHVIEPSLGVDRTMLVALLEAYYEEEAPTAVLSSVIPAKAGIQKPETETRVVLRLPKTLAPYKVAVLPLSKKEELSKPARNLANELRKFWNVEYDETQSIGKRYRRQDEIGTPYCVTMDFDSLEDKKVTVRDRDTMKQERVAISGLGEYLKEKLTA